MRPRHPKVSIFLIFLFFFVFFVFFVGKLHGGAPTRGTPWQLNHFDVITLYQQLPIRYITFFHQKHSFSLLKLNKFEYLEFCFEKVDCSLQRQGCPLFNLFKFRLAIPSNEYPSCKKITSNLLFINSPDVFHVFVIKSCKSLW